jgi:3,4-dihydroxy 2-butanone 4-phosphate synthase/GTP cyclohydrolase II
MRPRVTLSYAQSLDGSLTTVAGRPLALSSPASLTFTHELRAAHDAVLVGIGTVLADDPRLTLRLASGAQPQPIVLDGHLRLPRDAQLWQHPRPPWIATTEASERQAEFESAGARVLRLPADHRGRVSLPALLKVLARDGIARLMVEGGSAVITSFLAARLVDRIALTIAPRLVGGLRAVDDLGGLPCWLENVQYEIFGPDIVVQADVNWRPE